MGDSAKTSAESPRSFNTTDFNPISRNARDKTASDAFENNFSSVESCTINSGIAPICLSVSIKFSSVFIQSSSSFAISSKLDFPDFSIISRISLYMFFSIAFSSNNHYK